MERVTRRTARKAALLGASTFDALLSLEVSPRDFASASLIPVADTSHDAADPHSSVITTIHHSDDKRLMFKIRHYRPTGTINIPRSHRHSSRLSKSGDDPLPAASPDNGIASLQNSFSTSSMHRIGLLGYMSRL